MPKKHANRIHKGKKPMRQIWIAIAIVLCVYIVVFASTLAKPSKSYSVNAASSNHSFQSSTVSPITSLRAGNISAAESFNITFNITNDLAYGVGGYWALGNYTRHVLVVQNGNRSYYAVVESEGTWKSIKGARNPVTGIPEQENATGNFISIYNATLPGVLNTSLKLNGYVGKYNVGGTFADILENQSDQLKVNITPFNWPKEYLSTSAEYMTLHRAETIFTLGNQTMIIRCIGSNDNCTFSGTGPYFGGGLHANSTS